MYIRKLPAAAFALSLVFCLSACGGGEKEQTAEPVDVEPVVEMSVEELAEVEEAFYVMLTVNGQMEINPLNCFLTSYYDSVDKMDLQAFLRYFPDSGQGTEAEFEALRNYKDWPFSDCKKLSDMPVPLHRYDGAKVRAALEKYGDVSFEQFHYENAPGVYYLEEYDSFYNYTSDFGLFPLRCVRGERQGDRLYLYSEEYGDYPDKIMVTLTLEKRGDNYIVISRMPVEIQ